MVFNALKQLVEENHSILKKLGANVYHKECFVFTNRNNYPGYPLYPKLIQNRMERLLKLSEINPDLTPHSFRHTHCSLLLGRGEPRTN